MRVLVVTTWVPTVEHPSKAIFVKRHIDALAIEHEVHVAALSPAGTEVIDFGSVPVTSAPFQMRNPRSLAANVRTLRRLVRSYDPDVVHTMGFSALPFGLVHGRRPWVHTDHWSGLVDPASAGPGWKRLAAARHLLRLPGLVTVVSSYMADALRPFTRNHRVVVVPNVVNSDAVLTPVPPATPLRLITIGGLIEAKRPILAVDTLVELVRRGVDAQLTFVGDGALRDVVLAHAAGEGVGDRVTLTGAVPPAEVTDHLDRAHILLHTSGIETFSVVAAEAVLRGRPVVIGDSGGPRDFIADGNGFRVVGSDPGDYADAVLNAMKLSLDSTPAEIARTLGDRFSPTTVAADFTQAYRLAGAS